jgi:hypothetical protein
MLNKNLIVTLLQELNEKLKQKEINGEIGIVGGAAMCLAYNSRCNTKDVDAIFQPSREIRAAAREIAENHNINSDWLNDGVKGFLSDRKPEEINLLSLSNLKVWTPEPEYMLAMKSLAARMDSNDGEDLRFLIKLLGYKSPGEVFKTLSKYYPNGKILVKTQYFIEEIFEN